MVKKKPRCRAVDLILADINNNYELDSSIQSEQSNNCSSDVAGAIDNSSILSTTISFNSDVSPFGTPSLYDEETLNSDEDDSFVCKNTSVNHNLDHGSSSQNKFKYSFDFSVGSPYDQFSSENDSEKISPFNSDSDSIINDSSESKSGTSSAYIHQTPHQIKIPFSDSDSSSFKSATPQNKKIILLEEEEFIKAHKDQDLDKIPPSLNIATSSIEPIQNVNTINYNKVGSFNIQNQFDHMAAGELFLKGNFSILSLQEPHAAHTRCSKSWESFMTKELEEARISATFSKYQVLLLDDTIWGSRIAEDITILQNGRIISVVVKLNKDEFLGFVCVYAITCSTSNKCSSCKKIRKKIKTRKKTTDLIKSTIERWKAKFPKINPVILGDIQETISTEDRDNKGSYRRETPIYGIINSFQDSHYSVVRNRNKDIPYWTREGPLGSRGIDHILCPKNENFANYIDSAAIEREFGEEFFPSDHSLISCTLCIQKTDPSSISSNYIKNCYRKISSIKIKFDQEKDIVSFDDSQFLTKEIQDQKKLFNEIQQLTNPNTNKDSKAILDKLTSKSNALFRKIWSDSISQNKKGINNDLFECDDHHFDDMEDIANDFSDSVKAIMSKLKLKAETNINNSTKRCRDNIKSGGGFRLFDSLPITTKLRYIKFAVRKKARALKAIIKKTLRENETEILSEHEDHDFQLHKGFMFHTDNDHFCIENQIDRALKLNLFNDKASEVAGLLMDEQNEWKTHIETIESHKKCSKRKNSINDFHLDNPFEFEDENIIKDINGAMLDLDCKQLFGDFKGSSFMVDCLSDDINLWEKELIRGKEILEFIHLNGFDSSLVGKALRHLNTAKDFLTNLDKKIINIQSRYKDNKMIYYAKINKPGNLKRKLLPIKRDTPKAHTIIWDEADECYRKCNSVKEELQATGNYHGEWMDKSKARESCAFAKVLYHKKGGARGVRLDSKRIVLRKDIKNLIAGGKRGISHEIREAFKDAHQGPIGKLFAEPEKDNDLFNYPFFITNKSGTINDNNYLLSLFNKAVNSIPGKARFDGFHLAVLGRFDPNWRKLVYDIVKLVLMTRYMPHEFKKIARIPIPKPNAANEYRPISLCHDIYCFINGIVADITARALEKAGLLPETLAAYREGKGCSMLVATELGLREDCVESNIPACRLDEDEEKFFDRICLELILAVLRINGFPTKGFLELKASCMWDKNVEILTNRGSVFSMFKCGLEQGNPDSPKMANLVIKLKHILWNSLTAKLKDEYKMFSVDIEDGVIKISSTGFSDDNTENNQNQCVEDLIKAIQKYIKLSGDLSMVLKIGRKGSKCVIYLYNIPAEKILNLPTFETIAWSFKEDRPTKEIIPVKIYLQKEEVDKLAKLIKDPEMKEKAKLLLDKKDNKHLGLYMDLEGDTQVSSIKTLQGARERLKNIKLYNLNVIPLKISANMLITTMHSFAPLQKNHKEEDLLKCDKMLMNTTRKACGFCKNDSKHLMFLGEKFGGHGLKTFQETDLKANARELEVILNDREFDGKVLRSRVEAIKNRISLFLNTHNHVRDAANKLAKFGIYLRDRKDGILNRVLDLIAIKKNWMPVGDNNFNGGNDALLGPGLKELTQTALGSTWYTSIKNLLNNTWSSQQVQGIVGEEGLELIDECLEEAFSQDEKDKIMMLPFREWLTRPNPYKSNDPMNDNNWSDSNISIESESLIKNQNDGSFKYIWNIIKREIEINPLDCLSWSHNDIKILNDKGRVLRTIFNSSSPIIISTDGGNEKDNSGNNHTSAAMVIGMLDIFEGESIESGEWMNRKIIPLLIRSCTLPDYIGAHESDNNQGEALALCMGEECLPKELARCIIMDSYGVRSRALTIRDDEAISHRKLIRKIFPGIGKGLVSRLSVAIEEWNHTKDILDLLPSNSPQNYVDFCVELRNRNVRLANCVKNWREEEGNEDIKMWWKGSYLDDHPIHSIWKVDSHQLNKNGDGIKDGKHRFPRIVPQLAFLNANHWADIMASKAIARKKDNPMSESSKVKYSDSKFRFFFTYKGDMIDKNTCHFIDKKLELERVKRLQNKEAHGQLCRFLPFSTTTPQEIPFKSSWRRFLLYLSNTHTRASYKNPDYNKAANLYITNKLLADYDDETLNKDYLEAFDLLEHVKVRCPWCHLHWSDLGKQKDCQLKGNRRHMLLFCGNTKLTNFRNYMKPVIENALVRLHKKIEKLVEKSNSNFWLYNVQNILIQLQNDNAGRLNPKSLSKSPKTKITNYLPIKDWANKLQISSIEEGIHCNKDILSHIFGLRHVLGDGMLQERDCGIVDGIVLGIIPKKLHNGIINSCKEAVKSINCKEERLNQLQGLKRNWREVIKLIRINVIGIHRLCNDLTRDYKMLWMEKFNLTSTKKIKIQEDKLRKEEESSSNSDSDSDSVVSKTPINVISSTQSVNNGTKLCDGLKCGNLDTIWVQSKNFKRKRIKSKQKTCQACSKLSNALHKCIKISKALTNCKEIDEKFTLLRNSALKDMQYISNLGKLGDILEELLTEIGDGTSCCRLKDANGKITDNARLILRCLGQCLDLKTRPIFSKPFLTSITNQTDIFILNDLGRNWAILKNITVKWERLLDIKPNKLHANDTSEQRDISERQDNHLHLQEDICIENLLIKEKNHSRKRRRKQLVINDVSSRTCNEEMPLTKSPKYGDKPSRLSSWQLKNSSKRNTQKVIPQPITRSISIPEIELQNRLLSDTWAENLIKHFRSYNNNHVFIAGAFTSQILTRNNNCNWREIGRLFRNENALHKRQGIYLIPSFIGSTNSGHWYLNLVYWNGNSGCGYTLDSYNMSGSDKSRIRDRIRDCFGGSDLCQWEEITCIQQSELECGPRMLWSMHSITKDIIDLSNVDAIIREAANLTQLNLGNRNLARTVREKVGNLAKQYLDSLEVNAEINDEIIIEIED